MARDEIDFIKKAVVKTGFPLEIEVSSILNEDGWKVLPSSPYFDEDEGKWREIDIKAYKSADKRPQGKSIKPYRLTLSLIIECKKSEELAWVFFPQHRSKEELKRVTNIILLDFLTVVKRQSLLKEQFNQTKLFPSPSELRLLNMDPSLISEEGLVTPDIARKLKFLSELEIIPPEAFRNLNKEMKARAFKEIKLEKKKNKSHPSEIFEAVNELIKAIKYDLILASFGIYAGAHLMKRETEQGAWEIEIFLPVLIFDGSFYSWINGDVRMENEILLEGRCHTKSYFENMLISVVTKDHIKDFLVNINNDLRILANRVYENREKLDKQIKMIIESQQFTRVGLF